MNKKNKFIKIFNILFISCLFLTGCTSQIHTVEVREDDSISFNTKITIDTDTYALLESYNISINDNIKQNKNSNDPITRCNPLFQEYATQFYNYGFSINPIEDNVEIGFQVSKNYHTPEDFNKDIKKIKEANIMDLELFLETKNSFSSKNYLITGTLGFFFDSDSLADISSTSQVTNVYDIKNLKAQLDISMPGNAKECSGSYNNGIATFNATADLTQGTSPTEVLFRTSEIHTQFMGIVLIIIIIIGLIAFFIISRKLKRIKEQKSRLYDNE